MYLCHHHDLGLVPLGNIVALPGLTLILQSVSLSSLFISFLLSCQYDFLSRAVLSLSDILTWLYQFYYCYSWELPFNLKLHSSFFMKILSASYLH